MSALCRAYGEGRGSAFPRLALLDLHSVAVASAAAEALLRSCPVLECLRADFGSGMICGLFAAMSDKKDGGDRALRSLGKVQFRDIERGSRGKRGSAALALFDELVKTHPHINWQRWPSIPGECNGRSQGGDGEGVENYDTLAATGSRHAMQKALRSLKRKIMKK